MADDKPIIVIKKKGSHGGHHGGAWKIAYADFVTAMMAFFMVMWLLSAATSTQRKLLASYFRKPGIFNEGSGTPLLIGAAGILNDGLPPSQYRGTYEKEGIEQAPPVRKDKDPVPNELAEKIDLKIEELKKILEELKKHGDADAGKLLDELSKGDQEKKVEKESLEQVAEKVKQKIMASPELKELLGAVDVKVDADGLTIEIMDTVQTSMFSSGSSTILPDAAKAFTKLAGILNTVPNKIDVIGHTDATPFRSRTGSYTNWELSADRANAARKLLEAQGLQTGRIESVIGKADSELKNKDNPTDASNRRITLKIRFSNIPKTDLAKNTPDMLKNFTTIENNWQKKNAAAPQDQTPSPIHSLTVKDIIDEAAAQKRAETAADVAAKQKADKKAQEIEKGLIFKENPVLSPSEFFDQ